MHWRVSRTVGVLAALALFAGCSSCPPPDIIQPDPPPTLISEDQPTPHPICTAAQLAISMGESDTGNPGTMNMHWVFTNRGPECYTRGWPTVMFTDDQGRTVYAASHDSVGALTTSSDTLFIPVVRLHTGDKASVFWTAIQSDSEPCLRSTHIRITPPEAHGWAYAPDGGYTEPGWWCRAEVGLMTAGSSNTGF